jgi:hypothetical protein
MPRTRSTPVATEPAPLRIALTSFTANGKVILEGGSYRSDEPFVTGYPERFVDVDTSEAERNTAILAMNRASRERAERNDERYAAVQRRSLPLRITRRPSTTKLEGVVLAARKRQADLRDEYAREDRALREQAAERKREEARQRLADRERERVTGERSR